MQYLQSFPEIISCLLEKCREGDLVLTLGAGDVHRVGEMFLAALEERE